MSNGKVTVYSSTLDMVKERAFDLSSRGVLFIKQHSETTPVNVPGSALFVINPYGDNRWSKLSAEGKILQTELLPEIERFNALVIALTQNLPSSVQRNLIHKLEKIWHAIEQDRATTWETKDAAVCGFKREFDDVCDVLESYFRHDSDVVFIFPDTNALIRNPDLDKWKFNSIKHFTLLMTPTILAEIDSHKVNHKNQNVREKAEKLGRQFREYRRRGSMHQGVAIVKGQIDIRWLASEPDMAKSLPWLRSDNDDDRFLASVIEVIRSNLSAVAFIVTEDTNMLNKADYASIPSLDVPVQANQS